MARNGSGTYSNPYPNFVSGTVISSTEVDSNNSDIATALTQSIAVDGQSVVTGDIPLATHKFTAMKVGTASTDSLSLGQAQAEAFIWCGTASGGADAITLSPTPAITAYAAGQRFVWMASGSTNTGATTVAISGLGAIALQDNGAALTAGQHAASKMFMGILNTTSTVQIMQVQISGTDPLIISSLTVTGDATIGDDLTLLSDASILGFGTNTDVTITHVHDSGLTLKNTSTGDDTPFVLLVQTGETDIALNDALGKIQFQAPDEGAGTDAILVAAEIAAISEGDFSTSNNATKLSFKTGASEAATEKMSISSVGNVTMKETQTGDGTPMTLLLQTGETDIAAADILGKIQFQAPDEAAGTDAILVAAEIAAVSEGDFSSSSNATSLSFKTGASEAATQKMVINSDGDVGIGAAASTTAKLYVYNNSADHYVFYGYQAATGTAYPAMYIVQKGDNTAIYGQCDGAHYGVRGYSEGSYGAYFSTATSGGLGRGMYAVGEGKYFIGGMSDATYGGYSNGGYWSTTDNYAGSDSRLKDVTKTITTSDGILAKVNQLKPIMFTWKENSDGYVEDASPHCGFLAQEVETIFPDLIDEVTVPDMSGEEYDNGRSDKTLNEQLGTTYGMSYDKVCVYLTAALQELSAKNDALEARIKTLEDA